MSTSYDDIVINEIRDFITNVFYRLYGVRDSKGYVQKFLNNESEQSFSENEIKSNNIYKWENNEEIKVELATIHAVKGETLISTLYLETSYQGKHESEWIMPQLIGEPITDNNKARIKECLKIAYVGMSRPKYLLCMAIHKERFDEKLDKDNGGNWVVVHI